MRNPLQASCCCFFIILAISLFWFSGTILSIGSGIFSLIGSIFSLIGRVIFSQWMWAVLVFIWNIVLYGIIQNVALPYITFYPCWFYISKKTDEIERMKELEGYDKQLDRAIKRTRELYIIIMQIILYHAILIALQYFIPFIRDSYIERIGTCISLAFSAFSLLGSQRNAGGGRRDFIDLANLASLSVVFYLGYLYVL